MERTSPPGLIWTDAFPETCALTGGPIEEREARIECVGTGRLPEDLLLAYSPKAACWYAPLGLLVELAKNAGVSPFDAGPFRIDGVEERVDVMTNGKAMPWDAFAAAMRVRHDPNRPAPTFREVRALPAMDETWELAFEEAEGVSVAEKPGPVFVAVVADATGAPRGSDIHVGRYTVADLAEVVRKATRHPQGLGDARPHEVRVDDPALVPKLEKLLKPAGIRVRRGDTPDAFDLLDDLLNHLGARAGFDLPALFADEPDADVQAYFDAAARFYTARPWERLDGNRFLAVQDAGAGPGAPWTYVSVMGQMEDQPGLSVFRTWPDVCRTVYDRRGAPDLDALGEAGLQGVTLYLESDLNPDDAQRIAALEIGPTSAHQFALPVRLSLDGASLIDPPLAWTTALLAGLPDVLAKRRAATVTSIKTTVAHGDVRLNLRYPARGDEGLAPGLGGVRLTVTGAPPNPKLESVFGFGPEILGPGDRLVVEGPPGTSAFAVGRAVRRAFETAGKWGMLNAVLADGREVWDGRAYATEAAPTLDDLLMMGGATFLLGMAPLKARAERLAPDAAPDLRAEIITV